MASKSFSLDSSGFPSKPSRFRTCLWRSVKRTVSGLRVSNCSKSDSPISRASCQVMGGSPAAVGSREARASSLYPRRAPDSTRAESRDENETTPVQRRGLLQDVRVDSVGGRLDGGADEREGLVGVGAEGGDGGDAH